MDVVEKIASVPTDSETDRPLEEIVVYTIEITEYK
jgi:hypothetical protein